MFHKFNLAICFCIISSLNAQDNLNNSKFKQLHEELPTPNVYRTASGAPGHEYYQQKADYEISVDLDEENIQDQEQDLEELVIRYQNWQEESP